MFDTADLFATDNDAAAQHVAAYVLFILGLFCLLAGVWFALIEARRPPDVSGRGVDATEIGSGVGSVIDKLRGNKVSTILFAIGVALLAAAAAGSGLIDISVGDASGGSTTG